MKLLILLSVIVAVVSGLSQEDTQKITKSVMKIAEQCRKEVGANAEDITKLMQKKVPSRKEGKCLIFCAHQKLGFQEASGKVRPEGITEWINNMKSLDSEMAGKMQEVADKCMSKMDDSGEPCEVAATAFECYMAKAKELEIPMVM